MATTHTHEGGKIVESLTLTTFQCMWQSKVFFMVPPATLATLIDVPMEVRRAVNESKRKQKKKLKVEKEKKKKSLEEISVGSK